MGCGGFSRRDISLARFRQNNPGAINFDGTNTYTVVDDVTVPFLINIAMKADELLIINGGVTFTILGAVSNFEADEYTTNSDIITNKGTINMEDRSGICFGLTGTPVNSCIKNEGTFNKNGGEITINKLSQSEGIINEGTFNFNKGPFIVKDMEGGTTSVAIQNTTGDFNVSGGSISIPDLSTGAIGIKCDAGTFAFSSGSITIGNIQQSSIGILGNGGNFTQTDGSITIGDVTDASGFFNSGTSTLKNINIGIVNSQQSLFASTGIGNSSTLTIQDGNVNIEDITANNGLLSAGIFNFLNLTIINSSVNLGNIEKLGSGDAVGIFNTEGQTYNLTINNSNITISQISDGVGISCADNGGNTGVTLTNNSTIIVTEPTDNSGKGFVTLNNTVDNQVGCTINMKSGTGYTPYTPDKTNNPPWDGGGTYEP